ncbi:MAG TPA: GNAT family N-acetyltransferase [Acidimicrobiales bacterium]|nr:GNAT family N-acetyltransferase [Acidimicrobiales bacterium]
MIKVERVPAEVTFPLRQRVLRPHQRVEDMALPGDDDPHSGHFAAIDGDGRVVGTATVRRERPPWEDGTVDAWRLRGMATEEGWRGRGVGGAALAAVLTHVAAHGGGLLWCNARLPAVPFYERAGFSVQGAPFDEPGIGPHVVMARRVDGVNRT